MQAQPSSQTAVVACMDCRLDVMSTLGLELGQAHIIRNAGGVISDDVRRSLMLSQVALGTNKIILIHHTKCGVEGLNQDELYDSVENDLGERPDFPLHAFDDVREDVTASIATLKADKLIPKTDDITGYVYDVDSGELERV